MAKKPLPVQKPTTPTTPSNQSELFREAVPSYSEKQHAVHIADIERREQDLANADKRDAMAALWRARGSRYKECTFENFSTDSGYEKDRQAKRHVKDTLEMYCLEINPELTAGTNIILIGPPGTGKDHLLAALMRQAVNTGHTVKWTSGAKLFARLRDDIESHAMESATVAEFARPDVLVISDPVWDNQPLTRQQRLKLGEIIDTRYNNRRATWVSINAVSGDEAAVNLGAALVDRLRDGAVTLACNWPSARKPRGES